MQKYHILKEENRYPTNVIKSILLNTYQYQIFTVSEIDKAFYPCAQEKDARSWLKLKKYIDKDAHLWRKLNHRTREKLKSYKCFYERDIKVSLVTSIFELLKITDWDHIILLSPESSIYEICGRGRTLILFPI